MTKQTPNMSKRQLDDGETKEVTKKQKRCCISCSGSASTTFTFCPKGCKYDVCVECVFGFTEMRYGKTFDKMRIKCMICREPLPSKKNTDTVRKLLLRRNKFYTILDDTITGDKVILAKDPKTKSISLSKINEYVNHSGVIINYDDDSDDEVEEVSLSDLIRSTPAFVPTGLMNPLHLFLTSNFPQT